MTKSNTKAAKKNGSTNKVLPTLEQHKGQPAAPKASMITLEGTKLFQKDMTKDFKGVEAVAYAVIDEKGETITYVNTYKGIIPASYSPAPYTFEFKGDKTLRKLEKKEWSEVEADQWPDFVKHTVVATAGTRKPRKTAAKA